MGRRIRPDTVHAIDLPAHRSRLRRRWTPRHRGVRADALGSTANYLRRAGWVKDAPWGYEVRVPAGYKGPSGRRQKQAIAQWTALGITRIDGLRLDGPGPAALLLPAGSSGPRFSFSETSTRSILTTRRNRMRLPSPISRTVCAARAHGSHPGRPTIGPRARRAQGGSGAAAGARIRNWCRRWHDRRQDARGHPRISIRARNDRRRKGRWAFAGCAPALPRPEHQMIVTVSRTAARPRPCDSIRWPCVAIRVNRNRRLSRSAVRPEAPPGSRRRQFSSRSRFQRHRRSCRRSAHVRESRSRAVGSRRDRASIASAHRPGGRRAAPHSASPLRSHRHSSESRGGCLRPQSCLEMHRRGSL